MKPKFAMKRFVMHCKTQHEADIFCKYLDAMGERWCDGSSYLDRTSWDWYRDQTCYDYMEGMLSYRERFRLMGYTIYEFSDFDWSDWE